MRARNTNGITARKARLAITDTRVLDDLDGRTVQVRRYKHAMTCFATDLGGEDQLTQGQLQLVRSAAGLALLRERLDAKALADKYVPIEEYTRITNALTRVVIALGLKRVSRNVTPDLETYLRGKRGRPPQMIDHDMEEVV